MSPLAAALLASLDDQIVRLAQSVREDATALEKLQWSCRERRAGLAELKRIRQTLVHGPTPT